MRSNPFAAASIVSLLVLAGCDSAPNDAQVKQALQTEMSELVGEKAAAEMTKELYADVKVLGCSKSDKGGYECDVKTLFGVSHARFVKTGSVWAKVSG